jgi:alpha-L-arabinofuranosidase
MRPSGVRFKPVKSFLRILGLFALAGAAPLLAAQDTGVSPENLLINPGFEVPIKDGGWYFNPALAGRGLIVQSVFGRHSGRRSLKLIPNGQNTESSFGAAFGLAQEIPASSARGPLYFGGWLAAEGGATSVLRVFAVSNTGAIYFRELRHRIPNRLASFYRDVIDLPDDPGIQTVVLSCTVEGTEGASYFDDLFVRQGVPGDWLSASGDPDPGADLHGIVEVDGATRIRTIPREIFGTNVEWIWGGQGLIAPGSDSLDETLLDLGKTSGISSIRFPGGFFSDFYHWRNGVGPRYQRPIVHAFPAVGAGLSSNDFGTDEALQLADKLGANLLMTVNVATGTAQEAADWVGYVNRDSRRVEHWEVGNELYVDLSSFDPALSAMPPEIYTDRYLEYARAMKSADPTIKVGAILDFNYGSTTYRPFPNWVEVLLSRAGPEIDFVSVHNAFAPVIGGNPDYPVRSIYKSMLAAPIAIKQSLDGLSTEINRLNGQDSDIGIVVSEWGPLFEADPASKYIDHSKTLGSALFVAHVLKVFAEHPRVTGANAFKFLDRLPNGWIGVRDGKFVPKAPLFALRLFSRHFGNTLLRTLTSSPGYDSRSIGWVDAAPWVPYLESTASFSDEGKLYVMMINKHFDRNLRSLLLLHDYCPSGSARVWTLGGSAIDANTGTQVPEGFAEQVTDRHGGRFHLGSDAEVTLTESSLQVPGTRFEYILPPHSVVSLEIEGAPGACPDQGPVSAESADPPPSGIR